MSKKHEGAVSYAGERPKYKHYYVDYEKHEGISLWATSEYWAVKKAAVYWGVDSFEVQGARVVEI